MEVTLIRSILMAVALCVIVLVSLPNPSSLNRGSVSAGSPSLSSSQTSGAWRLYRHGLDRRYGQVVLPLQDGRVLVTSGGAIGGGRSTLVATTEIFDPKTGSWVSADDIPVPGVGQSAVQLSDGDVLIAGGSGLAPDRTTPAPVFAASELFSPSTGRWTVTGNLQLARKSAAMVVLRDGSAMIIGGSAAQAGNSGSAPVAPGTSGASGTQLASTEHFDTSTRTWALSQNMATPRSGPVAVALADGRVLVAGGSGPVSGEEAAALEVLNQEKGGPVTQGPILTGEIHNPADGSWHPYQLSFPNSSGRQVVTSAYRSPAGLVLGMSTDFLTAAAGRSQPGVPTARYPFMLNPATGAVAVGPPDPDTVSPSATSVGMPAGVLPDGRFVVAGPGHNFLYDPQNQTWSSVVASPLTAGQGGGPPLVSASGLVIVNVADQWAVLDPRGVVRDRASNGGNNAHDLTWWLTVVVIGLALIAALQFLIVKVVRSRLEGRRI